MNSFIETLNHWGGSFLSFAWPMLWQASLLITVLIGFDFLFRRRLRASIRYALWLVVLVKLCVPPTLALPTSPAWWLHKTPPPVVTKPATHYTVTYDNTPLPELPQTPLPALVVPPPAMNFAAWSLVVSVAVSSALLLWLLVRWWQITRQVCRAKTSERLAALAGEAGEIVGMKFKAQVRLTTNSMSPAVCGLFRPAILIPQALAENFSDEQLRAVLLHELIHLRRRDVWLNFLQALLQIFYWWHPLVWLANARIRRVREEAVDDAVMLALRDGAEAYAPTLLEVAKLALNRPLASLGLVGILESRHSLRQRIERLVDFRPPRQAGLTLVSLLGILAFTAVAVPMGGAPAPAEKETLPAPAVSTPPAAVQHTSLPAILITSQIYQIRAVDFEKFASGLEFKPPGASGDSVWSATPEKFRQLAESLEASGLQPITRPRIQTSSGMPASMYVGDGTNGIEFDCTPYLVGGLVDLTIQGNVVDAKGEETDTNLFSAKTAVENQGGIVIRMEKLDGFAESNLLVVTGVQLVTNSPSSRYQQRLQAIVKPEAGENFANNGSDRVAALLADTNYQAVLRELEQRGEVESQGEPKPASIRVNNESMVNQISAPLAGAVSESSGQSTATNLSNAQNNFDAKTETGRLVQDAKVNYEMGKLDEAEKLLKSALALEPENAAAKYYLGLIVGLRNNQSGWSSFGRQDIIEKLHSIRLDQVAFAATPLSDVLRYLAKQAKSNDPEKKGINFLIDHNLDDSANPGGFAPDGSAQTNRTVASLITIDPPLTNAQLGSVLDAVVRGASEPIYYSVQDFAIVFRLGKPSQPLEPRVFKVDTNIFPAAVLRQAAQLGFVLADDAVNRVGLAFRHLSATAGVNWDSPEKKAVYNDKTGSIYVEATAEDLRMLKQLVAALNKNQSAPQSSINALPASPVSTPVVIGQNTNTAPMTATGILADTNQDSLGRQKIVAKLDRIRFDRVSFDRLSLEEVVQELNESAKQNDPEKTGVHISTVTNSFSSRLADINSIVITIPSLADVRLVDVLDAVALAANKPIEYSILDDGVVFSAKDPADNARLSMRTFKVDKKVFDHTLGGQAGLQTNNVSMMARSFFSTLGVNLLQPAGKSVFFNDRLGLLFVKATKSDLDTIERALSALNQVPPQLHIKARFYEVPKGTLAGLEKNFALTNESDGKLVGILTGENAKAVIQNLQRQAGFDGFEIVGEPEATITSGRQMEMRATTMITVVTNLAFQKMKPMDQLFRKRNYSRRVRF